MKLPNSFVNEIFEQARREAPLEACGYLAGLDGEISQLIPMTNVDKSEEHFSFAPKEQFAAVKQARAMGLQLIGVYHSHPATPARPSEEDIRLAYDPSVVYVIASLADAQNPIKAFRINAGIVSPEPLELVD